MNPQIRFCKSFDGTRLAYAATGSGPPILKAPHWLTHLEYEWRSPIWRPWIEALSRRNTLVRMDERACGLSDWEVTDFSFDAYVRDLEAVADAAGFEQFSLLGHCQGAAFAVEYAARHPERVSHLVLLGGYVKGWMKGDLPQERIEELNAAIKLIEVGWGRDDPSYRQMFASQFLPGATLEQLRSLSELQRISCSAENAARLVRSYLEIDASGSAPRVRCPTLVVHARGDVRVPLKEGRKLASLIPGARLVVLESPNHILLSHEPAFQQFFEELAAFLSETSGVRLDALTGRENEVLERVAQGLDNAQIAAHLAMSEKTVRNHITRIFDKLGVANRPQAIVLARERGLGLQSRHP